LGRLNRWSEAGQRIDAAFILLQKLDQLGPRQDDWYERSGLAHRARAEFEERMGQPDRAMATWENAVEHTSTRKQGAQADLSAATQVSNMYDDAASVLHRLGNHDRASAFEKARLDLWRYWAAKLPNNSYVRRRLETS
jgi:tetratricopeptide (TPR) repeat protein